MQGYETPSRGGALPRALLHLYAPTPATGNTFSHLAATALVTHQSYTTLDMRLISDVLIAASAEDSFNAYASTDDRSQMRLN